MIRALAQKNSHAHPPTKSNAKSPVFPPVSHRQAAQCHAQNIVQYRKFATGRTQTSPTIQPIAGRAVGYICAIIAPGGQNCPFLAFSGFTLHPYTPHRKTRYKRYLGPSCGRPQIHSARPVHPPGGHIYVVRPPRPAGSIPALRAKEKAPGKRPGPLCVINSR